MIKIQQSDTLGDILVFLTGKEEIMQAVNTLDDYNIKNPTDKYAFLFSFYKNRFFFFNVLV